MLPDRLFFNTGITTYIWILNNKKKDNRKKNIQLINAKDFYKHAKKKLGEKSKESDDSDIDNILKLYSNFKDQRNSKICSNDYFKYTRITIDQFQKDKNGNIQYDKKKNPIVDKKKREYEKVPSGIKIENFIKNEVKPFLKDFYHDKSLDKIGYEFSLSKEFYEFDKLRSLEEIKNDIKQLDIEIKELEKDL